MRRTKIVYLIAALLLLFLYLITGAGAPVGVLIMMILYGILALAVTRITGKTMTVIISPGDMIGKGEPMPETLTIRNDSRIPVFLCEGTLNVTNRLTGESRREPVSFSLWPGQKKTQTFSIEDQYCGRMDSSVEDLRVYDPLKLFSHPVNAAGGSTGYITPSIGSVPIPEDYLDSYDMESYQYSQYEKGTDTGEVFGIREYQEGDSPKQIHWKLTAKMDDVMVKIPSYPIENNILLILDNLLDPGLDLSAEGKSKLVELFYSISDTLLGRDLPHSIGWYDMENQTFRLMTVRSREELLQTIPQVLGCGFAGSEYSTIYRYLEFLQDQGFTNHFLVTAQGARDVDRLESYGAVNVFRTEE